VALCSLKVRLKRLKRVSRASGSAPFRFPQLNPRITLPVPSRAQIYERFNVLRNAKRRLMEFWSVSDENNIPFARDESVSLTFAEYAFLRIFKRVFSIRRQIEPLFVESIALYRVTLRSAILSLSCRCLLGFPSGSFDTLHFPPERYPVRSAESIRSRAA